MDMIGNKPPQLRVNGRAWNSTSPRNAPIQTRLGKQLATQRSKILLPSSSAGPKQTPPPPPPPPPPLLGRLLGTARPHLPTVLALRSAFRTLFYTANALCLTHLFLQNLYSVDNASGPSMLPSYEVLSPGILVSKLHRRGRGVRVGDVVTYAIPSKPRGQMGLKRVLGMQGDYVVIDSTPGGRGKNVKDNKNQDSEEQDDTNQRRKRSGINMIQVPKGHCWLVGDNLPASYDSRAFGPVPLALIRGKVLARVWPLWDFKWVENPLASSSSLGESTGMKVT